MSYRQTHSVFALAALCGFVIAATVGCTAVGDEGEDHPFIIEARCDALFEAESERISADTHVLIEFTAEGGEGTGSVAHSDMHGALADPYFYIDDKELPVNHRLEVEGTVEWAEDDEDEGLLEVALEPAPEVPEEYMLTVTGILDIEGKHGDFTLMDAEQGFLCSVVMGEKEEEG